MLALPLPPHPARLLALLGAVWLAGCAPSSRRVEAVITADGSSTVYPLTEAVAEDFGRTHPGARVTIGVAGTGGGLRRFCRGNLDLANASRPISQTEAAACAASGVSFLEIPVAYDGIVVAVHPSNTWVDSLSIDELRTLWRHEAEGRLLRWADLRPSFPDREIHLFGAGPDSGTFEYFTGVVTGAPRDSRGDYTASEDDNLLVQGVAGDPLALGYFGYAYYEEHRDYLRAVPVRSAPGAAAVTPSAATIRSGLYQPLSRPVFIYVNVERLRRPAVRALIDYYVANAGELAGDVGYVAIGADVQEAVRRRVRDRIAGSVYLPAAAAVDRRALSERLGVH